jgi:uncharacterized membrane protein
MSKQQGKSDKQAKKTPSAPAVPERKFLFERRNYMILLAGLGLLVIGFLLMTGGQQPPDQFDPKVIYGFRNTTLSSFVVVIGFIVVLYSIFAKHKSETSSQ